MLKKNYFQQKSRCLYNTSLSYFNEIFVISVILCKYLSHFWINLISPICKKLILNFYTRLFTFLLFKFWFFGVMIYPISERNCLFFNAGPQITVYSPYYISSRCNRNSVRQDWNFEKSSFNGFTSPILLTNTNTL